LTLTPLLKNGSRAPEHDSPISCTAPSQWRVMWSCSALLLL